MQDTKTNKKIKKSIGDYNFSYFIYEVFSSLISAVIMISLILTFMFRFVSVVGSSMENTLHDNDWIVISDFFYKPDYGDIVVINYSETNADPLIKRIIALEGDEIDIDFEKGIVWLNGEILNEPYIKESTHKSGDMLFPLTVPKDCVFVMGDNRNNSYDSRFSQVNCINQNRILGKKTEFPFRFSK